MLSLVLNPPYNFVRWDPFYGGSNSGLKRLGTLPKMTELADCGMGFEARIV